MGVGVRVCEGVRAVVCSALLLALVGCVLQVSTRRRMHPTCKSKLHRPLPSDRTSLFKAYVLLSKKRDRRAHTDRGRATQRDREPQRHRDTETQRDTQDTQRHRDTERHKTHTQTHKTHKTHKTHTHTHRHRRHTHTHTQTQTHTHTHSTRWF